jgi:hypothetical protein
MLDLRRGRASGRKHRLFACACVRLFWWGGLSRGFGHLAVEASEGYADGLIGAEARMNAWDPTDPLYGSLGPAIDLDLAVLPHEPLPLRAAYAACWANQDNPYRAARAVIDVANAGERAVQAEVLRDLFGPRPDRIVTPPASVMAWEGGLVVKLAASVYEGRSLPEGTLDGVRLGVLADALEDAGCSDEELLLHFRSGGGGHWRGCWGIDLLLGKG